MSSDAMNARYKMTADFEAETGFDQNDVNDMDSQLAYDYAYRQWLEIQLMKTMNVTNIPKPIMKKK